MKEIQVKIILKDASRKKFRKHTAIIPSYKRYSIKEMRVFVFFNGILTFLDYLMPKPFLKKNSNGAL